MRLKKILILIHNYNYGGAEMNYINFANFLDKKKYNVRILTINNYGYSNHTFDNQITFRSCDNKKFLLSIFQINKFIKEFNPEYIYTSLPHFNVGILILKKFFFINSKIIIREANVIDPVFQDNKFKNSLFIILKRIFYKHAVKVIAITNSVKENLIDFQKIKSNNIVTIYNPIIDKKILNMNIGFKWIIDHDNPVLLSVGRLVKQKDFNSLIHAFSILKKNKNIKLIIIGDGPKKKLLYNLAKKLNVINDIYFIKSSNDVNFFLKYCTVLVCSSLWEATPTILAQGLKSKIPIVSTDFASAYELSIGSSNFKIAKRKNPKDLSNKIYEVITNKLSINENEMWKKFNILNFSKYESFMIDKNNEY